ncbi:hypothetical protein D3C74_317860 [compost metagenome]
MKLIFYIHRETIQIEEKLISLSEDQKAVLLKSLKDLHFANAQLHEWVSKDGLSEDMSKTLPSLIESYFGEIAKVLNYESYLLEEKEERYAEIRKANQTIHELEQKLGSNKPVDGLSEQLQHLSKTVRLWWNIEGFNYVSEEKFHPYGGFNAQFSFMLDSRSMRLLSETPVTDERNTKQHVQHLIDMGFEFTDFEDGRSEKLKLVDNQNNRTLLTKMLKERFPSIKIHQWDNRNSYSDPDKFVLWHIDATIYELSDI